MGKAASIASRSPQPLRSGRMQPRRPPTARACCCRYYAKTERCLPGMFIDRMPGQGKKMLKSLKQYRSFIPEMVQAT